MNDKQNNLVLHIISFGPLKDVQIETSPFAIYTGIHASGKTLVAQLQMFYRIVFINIFRIIYKRSNSSAKEFERYFSKFDLRDEFINQLKSIVQFDFNNVDKVEFFFDTQGQKLHFLKENGVWRISGSIFDSMENDFKQYHDYIMSINDNPSEENSIGNSPRDDMINRLWRSFIEKNQLHDSKILYIPASRSSVFLYQDSIVDKDDIVGNDNFTNFLKNFHNSKKRFVEIKKDIQKKLIAKMMKRVTNGYIDFLNDSFVFNMGRNKNIDINCLSSGQHEVLPIYIAFYHLLAMKNAENTLVVIEEPEAHLHPDGQVSLINDLVHFFNMKDDWDDRLFNFIITTHSPFVVDTLNNLIFASNIEKKYDLSDKRIIPLDEQLDFEKVQAYYFGSKVKSMKNKDLLLLSKGGIDDTAKRIVEIYKKQRNLVKDL